MGTRSNLLPVYIVSFLDLFAVGLIYPLLSPYLRDLGASHTFIGTLSSLYAGIQVVSGPVIGSWSDIRNRKTILRIILLICGTCYGLLGLANSFFAIVVLRIVLGVVKHIQSICKAVITDVLPKEQHTEAFGKSAGIASLGFIVGPLIGGQISELPNGFSYVCFLTMTLFFINIVVAEYFPDAKRPKLTSEDRSDSVAQVSIKQEIGKAANNLRSINWNKYWGPFALRCLFGLAMSTYHANQGLLLKERYELSQKHSGYVISYFSAISVGFSYFLGRVNRFYRNYDSLTRLSGFFLIMALSVVAIYVTPNLVIYLAVLVPFSMSCTALRIISMQLILQHSDGDHNGSFSGASNSVLSVSRLVASVMTGAMADFMGEETVILSAVLPAGLGGFLCFYLKRKERFRLDASKNK